ncbi:MAG: hypothetical protein LIP03_03160 [Bacteroidales bacterium]|nr:hypothetical protein [Bacteroidales bacterium]
MKPRFFIESLILLLAATFALCCCSSTNEADVALAHVNTIIEEHPDSALAIINGIDTLQLTNAERRARYALLKSMVLDKNYIDLTTMDVLQPAIDYYIDRGKGTPTDRMRTYYYQGTIHWNAQNTDSAMRCYLDGLELASASDSTTLARLHVGIGALNYSLYKYDKAILHYQIAHKYYGGHKPDLELDCQKRIFSCLMQLDAQRDAKEQLQLICQEELAQGKPILEVLPLQLYYSVGYDSEPEIRKIIQLCIDAQAFDGDAPLDIAHGYLKIGEPEKALVWLQAANDIPELASSMKRLGLLTMAYEVLGDYENALRLYKAHTAQSDSINLVHFRNDLASSEDRHNLEMQILRESTKKNNILLWGLFLSVIAVLTGKIFYQRHEIDIKEKKALSCANQALTATVAHLSMKNSAANELTTNLSKDLERLEEEKFARDVVLEEEKKQQAACAEGLSESEEQFNKVLLELIRGNSDPWTSYGEWTNTLVKDKEKLMDHLRLSFTVTHSKFIATLKAKGLNREEINYLCLLALGLNGAEIGKYLKITSQYNTSSEIRRKLGLDTRNANLIAYVRSLFSEASMKQPVLLEPEKR